MKLLILLVLALSLSATSTKNLQIQILEKILHEISIDQDKILWCDNKKILKRFEESNHLQTTQDCQDATVLILEDEQKLKQHCSTKSIFVLKYNLLKKIDKSFGALFWKKGRPNIVIIEPKIKEQKIKITKELEPYLEEKIW